MSVINNFCGGGVGGNSTITFSELTLAKKETISTTIANEPTTMYCELSSFAHQTKTIQGQMRYANDKTLVDNVTFTLSTNATYGFTESTATSDYQTNIIQINKNNFNTAASARDTITSYSYKSGYYCYYDFDLGEKVGATLNLYTYLYNTGCTIYHKDNESDEWISLWTKTVYSSSGTYTNDFYKVLNNMKRYVRIAPYHYGAKSTCKIKVDFGGIKHTRIAQKLCNSFTIEGNIDNGALCYCKTGNIDINGITSNTINNIPVSFILQPNTSYVLECKNNILVPYSELGTITTFGKKQDAEIGQVLCDGSIKKVLKEDAITTKLPTYSCNVLTNVFDFNNTSRSVWSVNNKMITSGSNILRELHIDNNSLTPIYDVPLAPTQIKYHNGIYYGIFGLRNFCTSTDLSNWVTRYVVSDGYHLKSCVYFKDKYLLVDSNGYVYYSTDLETFTQCTMPDYTEGFSQHFVYTNDRVAFIAICDDDKYCYVSSDGTTWTKGIGVQGSSSVVYGDLVSYNNKFYMGYYLKGNSSSYSHIYASTTLTGSFTEVKEISGVTYSGTMTDGEYLYLGNSNNNIGVQYCYKAISVDSTDLQSVTSPFSGSDLQVQCTGNHTVAIGEDWVIFNGVHFYFKDGSSYTNVKLPILNDTTNNLYGYIRI